MVQTSSHVLTGCYACQPIGSVMGRQTVPMPLMNPLTIVSSFFDILSVIFMYNLKVLEFRYYANHYYTNQFHGLLLSLVSEP